MTNIILKNKNKTIMKGIIGENTISVFMPYIQKSKNVLFLNQSTHQNQMYSKKFNKEIVRYMTYSDFVNLELNQIEENKIDTIICNDFDRNILKSCVEKISLIEDKFPDVKIVERICG